MEFKRNLKSLDNKTGARIVAKLNSIIAAHAYHKNCYFWSPPQNASARRAVEFTTELAFSLRGLKYEITQDKKCSCKNIYFCTGIYVDGNKKTISALKKLV